MRHGYAGCAPNADLVVAPIVDGDVDGLDVQAGGYWVKIEARTCEPSPQMPHGIRYSLTLPDRQGEQALGFDNARAVPKRRRGFSARRVEYDHWHPDGRCDSVSWNNKGYVFGCYRNRAPSFQSI